MKSTRHLLLSAPFVRVAGMLAALPSILATDDEKAPARPPAFRRGGIVEQSGGEGVSSSAHP